MNSGNLRTELKDNGSTWPISAMLLWGSYGNRSETERRYLVRYRIVVVLAFSWILVGKMTGMQPKPAMGLITLFLPALLFTYMAWEKRKYFLSLDELTRRIELDGMAWAYGIGVLTALWVGGLGYAASLRWSLDPKLISWAPFFLLAAVLASVKGSYRYLATRRYK
jgi:hypothetical protein